MSATGRSPRGGQGRDFYATPPQCTRLIIEALGDSVDRNAWWLEPACGNGAIEEVLNEFGISKVIATDIRPGPKYAGQFDYVHELDYLKYPNHRYVEVAITNPPFSHSFDFVQRMVINARVAVALLPLSFLASRKRHTWLSEHPPNLYVLSERPSFSSRAVCPCGWSAQVEHGTEFTYCPQCNTAGTVKVRLATDAQDYFWGVWGLPPQPIQFLRSK